jgi:hypothetical protein
MPADNELDPLDRWLKQQVRPLPPPSGTFELITRRARRRRIRKAVVSVASAAAVAVAVAVAVPVGMSLNLTTTPTNASLAGSGATQSSGATHSPLGTAAKEASRPASSSTAATAGSSAESYGPVPPNFVPSSVTWDSASTGWVLGQAGTPGTCVNANPYICTSIARTSDGGSTWVGIHAPSAGAPSGATGVSELRFLDGVNGWAFGPELWSTHNGGITWTQVNTGGQLVTDLETVGNNAYALFATCGDPQTAWKLIDHSCSSFTLEATPAGADDWAHVSGVPAQLPVSAVDGGAGMIEFTGTTGYLITPDNTLYSGPVKGGTWHQVSALPCLPGTTYLNNGVAHPVLFAPAGQTTSGSARLALMCDVRASGAGGKVAISGWMSDNDGVSWTPQPNARIAVIGEPQSLTATSAGTLILATSSGIYLLPLGASQWQAATLTGAAGTRAAQYGFTYVGMTTPGQGVALGGNPSEDGIWMTNDAGATWTFHHVKAR